MKEIYQIFLSNKFSHINILLNIQVNQIFSSIKFYNILQKRRINSYFGYMILNISKTYDEYILRLLARKYSLLTVTITQKKKNKINNYFSQQ